MVLTRLKNGKSLRVDVYCAEKAEAEGIADQFGGSVKHLADRNWVALSQEVGPPIKIRDSLLITQGERCGRDRSVAEGVSRAAGGEHSAGDGLRDR